MELRHLRYFVMVAEERHFTRAAARLNIQQPPLSQQIRALEDELGFKLFKRHPKGVDLTAGGEVFLNEARGILARVEEGARKAARAAQGIEGQLAVGLTSSAAAHPLIPRIIRAYRERFAGVAVSLREGSAQALTDAAIEGTVEVGILRAPVSQHPGIEFHRLLNEEMLLTLPLGHRLIDGYAPGEDAPAISLKALAEEDFILVRRPGAPGMYANLIKACQHAGFNPRIAFEVERMLTNVSLVAAGAGVSIVPASMRDVHKGSVVYCPIADARPRLQAPITLVCRGFNQLPPLRNFIALARELCGRRWPVDVAARKSTTARQRS
ncbi:MULTISPECIES: LysR family transcriptional regulator [unclassified Pseudomonas]|uniref:LysR family transcriptional regulator n=1 Tax=unclassified Pseudomonas TaxID=196821 RepID=UPI000BD43B5E|nr:MULTISPECIES: LysR family transcriptional regulator [unclassified Pseudomonas]PVZ20427.1 DNA-binding transcriptional LysR family regulator [Pseudomonas sp. URIL14HWK12:I12]PVZ27493.1 DNA-binding transcriptional LysR family regulator [Pseudomonas sp. URIL14HWK12:I10]PVZ38382.1 DNA-binding transcriptional LysR family regulator [Pseudomonas sp. URIL14HWK12:I11]SNZ03579.1 DNA-binding transcriptional regulator, LysR family [Pseudomonas sp. URIL14HWK12:I9]